MDSMANAGAPAARDRVSPSADGAFAGRAIVPAFVAVTVAFLAATAYSAMYARRIDALSESIALVATRGIEQLAGARASVGRVVALAEAHAAAGTPLDVRGLREAVAETRQHLDAYLALPLYEGESDVWNELAAARAALSDAADRVAGEGSAGATAPEVARLHAAADRVLDAAARSIELNAQRGREMAEQIKALRGSAIAVGLGLDLVAILVAVAGFVVVRREIVRFARLQRAHAVFLERRGDELESFAGRIAHDIRNPLAAARLATDLALRSGPEARVRELLERLARNVARAQAMIDALFEFARAGGAPEPGASTSVTSVVNDLIAELRVNAAEAGVDLEVEPFEPCEVACRPGTLASMLANLTRNALKHMGSAPRRAIAVRVLPRASAVRVEVEDTGPGIPAELIDRLFQPYVRGRTGQPGLGLGLATVKKLAEGHGGCVGVRSRVGEGSLFWFELPRAGPAGVDEPAAARGDGSAPESRAARR